MFLWSDFVDRLDGFYEFVSSDNVRRGDSPWRMSGCRDNGFYINCEVNLTQSYFCLSC